MQARTTLQENYVTPSAQNICFNIRIQILPNSWSLLGANINISVFTRNVMGDVIREIVVTFDFYLTSDFKN
jgi:hypothetical protein